MANPLAEAAVQAVELEAFAKGIPDYVYKGRTIYNFFKQNSKTYPVAITTAGGGVSRPAFEIPVRMQSGCAIFQATGNGDALGRGTGSKIPDDMTDLIRWYTLVTGRPSARA